MSELLLGVLLGVIAGALGSYAVSRWRRPAPQAAVTCQRPHLPAVAEAVVARAKELVAQQEAEGGNGELKRHRAYARLLKEFPETPSRQLALAIESAHEDLP